MDRITDLITEKVHFARRFGTGAPVLLFAFLVSTDVELADSVTKLNFLILSIFLLVAYTIGIIIEVLGELLIAQVAGASVWALHFPLRRMKTYPKTTRYFVRYVLWFLFPFFFYYYLVRSLVGRIDYRVDLSRLSDGARASLRFLPLSTQEGLENPLGFKAAHARQKLRTAVSEVNRPFVEQLFEKNSFILSVMSSLVIIAVFFISTAGIGVPDVIRSFVSSFRPEGTSTLLSIFDSLFSLLAQNIFLYFIPLAITLFSLMYIYQTERSIVNALEVYASDRHSATARHDDREESQSQTGGSLPIHGRAFQAMLLIYLVSGLFIEFVFWPFFDIISYLSADGGLQPGSAVTDSGLEFPLLIQPGTMLYPLLIREELLPFYEALRHAFVFLVGTLAFLAITWRSLRLTPRRICFLSALSFAGFLLGDLISEALSAILWNSIFESLIFGGDSGTELLAYLVDVTRRPVALLTAACFCVAGLYRGSPRAARAALRLVIVGAATMFALVIAVLVAETVLPLSFAGFSIGKPLEEIAIWAGAAFAIVYSNPRRQFRHAYKRRLRRYMTALAFASLTFVYSTGPWNGLDFTIAPGLTFWGGTWMFYSVAAAGLWQFATPIRNMLAELQRPDELVPRSSMMGAASS